jgi:hypothetical protein
MHYLSNFFSAFVYAREVTQFSSGGTEYKSIAFFVLTLKYGYLSYPVLKAQREGQVGETSYDTARPTFGS